MADLGEVEISVDSSKVIAATKEVIKLQTATDNYVKELKKVAAADLAAAREKRVLTQTIERMNPALDTLQTKLRKGNGLLNQYTQEMQKSTGAFGRYGFVAQQVGYQTGDFFVQIQSGTNVLVAFGQQMTQLVGLMTLSLNPEIMAWGVALSIAVPLVTALGAAWMRTSEDSTKSVDKISEAINDLKSDIDKAELDNIKVQFNTEIDSVAKARQQIAQLKAEIVDMQNAKPTLVQTFGQGVWVAQDQGSIDAAEAKKKELEAQLQILYSQLRVQENLQALEEASKLEAGIKLDALTKQREEYLKQQETAEVLANKTRYNKDLFHALAGETSSVSFYMSDALKSALGLSQVNFGNIFTLTRTLEIMQGQLGRGQPATGTPQVHYRTPLELLQYKEEVNTANTGRGIPSNGPITSYSNGKVIDLTPSKHGGGRGAGTTFEEYTKNLEQEVSQKQKMIGLYGQSAEIEKARYDAAKAMNTTVDKLTTKEIERIDTLTKQNYLLEQQQEISQAAYNSIHDAMMNLVDGTKSVQDAFKDMLKSILQSIWEQTVANPLAAAGSSLFSGIMSGLTGVAAPVPASVSANGNVFSYGSVQPFAVGGIVNSPTYFPMANGGAGLMGEAGPEAIMPLKRGSDGKLGIAGGGNVNITNNINISGTGDAAYVRGEVTKMLPQITGATKAAVIDARKRGGQMAAAFR